jgi:hypothetical protein
VAVAVPTTNDFHHPALHYFSKRGHRWLVRWLAPYTCHGSHKHTVLYFTTYDEISMWLRRQYQHYNLHHLAIGSSRGSGGGDDGSGVGHQVQTKGMSTNKQFTLDKEAAAAAA